MYIYTPRFIRIRGATKISCIYAFIKYSSSLYLFLHSEHFLYFVIGRTDPYVILRMGDQVIRSKKNSQTTVIGAPGQPIWNQVKCLYISMAYSYSGGR